MSARDRYVESRGLVLASSILFVIAPEVTIVSKDVTGNRAESGVKKWRVIYRDCEPSVHEYMEDEMTKARH
jgi:hypothetical protein